MCVDERETGIEKEKEQMQKGEMNVKRKQGRQQENGEGREKGRKKGMGCFFFSFSAEGRPFWRRIQRSWACTQLNCSHLCLRSCSRISQGRESRKHLTFSFLSNRQPFICSRGDQQSQSNALDMGTQQRDINQRKNPSRPRWGDQTKRMKRPPPDPDQSPTQSCCTGPLREKQSC